MTPSEPLWRAEQCRLCSKPRLRAFTAWGIGLAGGSPVPWLATGSFCPTHETAFCLARHDSYADMRIGQAVEAFCLASGESAP